MPLLVNSVPNLAQGVSQQPDNLRYPGQCDEQINAWATVVEGLKKRPNTNYVKNLDSTSTSSNIFTHFVKRDETNQYIIAVSLGSVSAYNLSLGTSIPVVVTSLANSYLGLNTSVTNPLQDLRALTVADYTFLVNKKRIVKRDTSADFKSKDVRNDEGKYEALVVVKLGDYEKTYDVYLDGKVVPYNSSVANNSNKNAPSGHTYESGTASDGTHADTEIIAEDLEAQLGGYIGSSDDGTLDGVTFSSVGMSGFENSGSKETSDLQALITTVAYEFLIDQYETNAHTTQIGFGAKGTMVIKDNTIQSSELTHFGNGYDGTKADDTYTLTIKKHELRTNWLGKTTTKTTTITSSTAGYVLPTFTPNASTGVSNFEVERDGSVIKIIADKDFSIRTEDGLANQGLGTVYKEVNSITDLPARCYEGFRVRVIGDADIGQDDYYVEFQTKDREEFGEGSWVETVGWTSDVRAAKPPEGIDTTMDHETMPVTLVPEFNTDGEITKLFLQIPNELKGIVKVGTTIYEVLEEHDSDTTDNKPGTGTEWQEYWKTTTRYTDAPAWQENIKYEPGTIGYAPRQAGDDYTNSFPTFTDKTINDVFFFKNRLGFVTDTSVVFSEADQYFNFFRTTTQQLLDSAPIDVGLSHTKTAILQHAIPFQEKLMLFSKQSQFVLRGADVLSPKTVAISPVTEYDISDSVEPVALGNYIYFTFKRNDFEGLYEYFVDNNTEVFDAEEVTQQVPKYIPKDVRKIAGSQAENTLVVSTSEDLKTLYVYKYFWSNKEKIQSAWMKFSFDRDVVGFDFIDSKLFMITKDTEGLHLEFLTLEDGLTDEGLDYPLLLDSRVDGTALTVSYSTTTKKSTISNFPYDPADVEVYSKIGHKYDFTKTTSTAGEVTGDITSVPFFAGVPYNMLYRFSDQSLKQPTERGGRSASDYTFQTIRNGSINYADTGHFVVEVTPKYRDTYKYVFNPDIVGANLLLNDFEPQNGHFRFAVQGQPGEVTIEVKSDSALPCKLLAAEFESMFVPRSRRYGS
jgi:hypothetical protein|tara:strand:+ start:3213 stop:6284 length:3072 start_codon:yes stop_codon:yes gene_type:complete